MENVYRNEKLLKVAGVEILLRPTFENIAAMESKVGGLAYIGWKTSRALTDSKGITLSELAQVIYFNQAATKADDPTRKLLSLEEVWDLVSQEGIFTLLPPMVEFIARITNGNKVAPQLSENQKKSGSTPPPPSEVKPSGATS